MLCFEGEEGEAFDFLPEIEAVEAVVAGYVFQVIGDDRPCLVQHLFHTSVLDEPIRVSDKSSSA